MTIKILDCTVISARSLSITSIDFLNRCCGHYDLVMTEEVEGEVEKCKKRIHRDDIRTVKTTDSKYILLLNYLQSRHPNLGIGELSSFLYALLNYASLGEPYYFITDDALMRKRIDKILSDPKFISMSGINPMPFNHTGTVGLIIRLSQKGIIGNEEAKCLYEDLLQNPYYSSPNVLGPLLSIIK